MTMYGLVGHGEYFEHDLMGVGEPVQLLKDKGNVVKLARCNSNSTMSRCQCVLPLNLPCNSYRGVEGWRCHVDVMRRYDPGGRIEARHSPPPCHPKTPVVHRRLASMWLLNVR